MNIETEIDLTLYDLERLGYWLEAEEAEIRWRENRPYFPPFYIDLPRDLRSEIGSLNAAMRGNH